MPLSRTRPWLRATSFRITLLQAGLLAAALAGSCIGGWFATRGAALSDARERISLEFDSISVEYRTEGRPQAAAALRDRSRRPGSLQYRLTSPSGDKIAGDMSLVDVRPGWQTVDERLLPQGAEIGQLMVFTGLLPDGYRLSVAEDMDRAEALRGSLFRTLLLWDGLALLLSLGIAGLLTSRALSRMDQISSTMRMVAAGDLSARIRPSRRATDDMDDLARQVNEMLDKIDGLVNALRLVSAEIAHDLRTPLAHVRQRLDLASSATSAEVRDEAVASAREGVASTLKIFDAMLRLAEIEAGSSRTRFAPLSLSAVSADIVDVYQPDIENGGGVLAIETCGGDIVIGDAQLVAQALSNLVENAHRHGGSGGRIEVKVKVREGQVEVSVRDHGFGLPSASRDKALRPFGRLDPARTTPGSGLGLPIVVAIVRLHGGDILFEDASPGLRVRLQFQRSTQQFLP